MIFLIFLMFSTNKYFQVFNVFHKIILLSSFIFCSPNLSYANQISNLLEQKSIPLSCVCLFQFHRRRTSFPWLHTKLSLGEWMEWRRPFNTICPGNLNVRAAYRESEAKKQIQIYMRCQQTERYNNLEISDEGVLRNILKQNKYSGNGTNIQQTSQIFSKLDKSI